MLPLRLPAGPTGPRRGSGTLKILVREVRVGRVRGASDQRELADDDEPDSTSRRAGHVSEACTRA